MGKSLEVLNVRKYGTLQEGGEKTDVHGNKVTLEEGVMLYFVNNVFSKPNSGFLILADGTPLTKSTDCTLTPLQMTELGQKAAEKIKKGELGDLGLKITL